MLSKWRFVNGTGEVIFRGDYRIPPAGGFSPGTWDWNLTPGDVLPGADAGPPDGGTRWHWSSTAGRMTCRFSWPRPTQDAKHSGSERHQILCRGRTAGSRQRPDVAGERNEWIEPVLADEKCRQEQLSGERLAELARAAHPSNSLINNTLLL